MLKVIMRNRGFTLDWLRRRYFSVQLEKETAQTREFTPSLSFELNTMNLKQVAPNYYYP